MILLHYSYVLGYNSFNTVTFVQSSELQEGFVRPRLLQWSDYNWEDLELIAISYPFKKEQEMHLFISHFLPEEIVCVFEGNREDFKNIFSPLSSFTCSLKLLQVCYHTMFYSSIL